MLPQTDRLSFKVLRTDKAALRRCANAEGESMSVVARRILRDGLKRQGFWPLTNAEAPAQESHAAGRDYEGVNHG